MPDRVKIPLSVVVALVAIGGFFFQRWLGQTWPSYACLFLGAFAVWAMWVFPEIAKDSPRPERNT